MQGLQFRREGERIVYDPGVEPAEHREEPNVELYMSLSDARAILEGRMSDELREHIRGEIERASR